MIDRTVVYFRTKVEGFHYYEAAPEPVVFLKHRHRHMFGVRVDVRVTHDDRDVEFIIGKRLLELYLKCNPIDGPESCEMIARRVAHHFDENIGWSVARVEVDEDGENGAIITFDE